MAALESVMEGRAYYSPSVQQELSNVLRAGSALGRPRDLLTDRELDVLKLVARGLSTKEIAGRPTSVRAPSTRTAPISCASWA